MTTATTTAPKLSDDDIAKALSLMRRSDSVELKLTVAEEQQRSTAIALGMDPLEAQLRLVAFFDTPDLVLDRHGLVVRARRIQGKGDDSVVKLRPVDPGDLPAKLRQSENFRVEVDALPVGFVCSGTMKAALGATDVRAAVAGKRPVRKLFTKEQREMFAAHAPDGIGLDDLTILGPLLVLKLRFAPEELGRRLVAEMWLYPDGSRILELSTRCATDDAFQVAAETRAFLTSRGIDITADQETKTRKALRFFAGTP